MPEDGIGFGAYDSVKDSFEASFLEDSILDKLANKTHGLIAEYGAFSRFQDQLLLWDRRFDQQLAAEDEWCQRQEEHERWAITQARWLNEPAGPPEPGWCFEQFRLKDIDHMRVEGRAGPVLGAWFPPELCSHNRPEAELPLPPQRGEIEISAKYAALSAIYDYRMKGQRKLGDGLNLKHYDLLLGIKSPVGERDGLVAQIPNADKDHLWTWLDDIERDLQVQADHPAEEPPAVTKDELAVLTFLVEKGSTLQFLTDIEVDVERTRKTAGQCVNNLIGKNLAHRPCGKNSGVTATLLGQQTLSDINSA